MKRLFIAVAALMLAVACAFSVSCADGGSDCLFAFLSVRLKGNGDGTVSAYAQNEFALTGCKIPVTLELYCSQSGEDYYLLKSVSSDGLGAFETLSVTAEVGETSAFYERIVYLAAGEIRYISSACVTYGTDGIRVM